MFTLSESVSQLHVKVLPEAIHWVVAVVLSGTRSWGSEESILGASTQHAYENGSKK